MFIILALVIIIQINSSLACSCFPQTAKEVFCSVDWVSHVAVNSRILIPVGPGASFNNWQYEVDHIQIFKGPYDLGCTVITPQDGATCGVTLDVGKEYLLAGRVDSNGILKITLCDHIGISEGNGNEWNQISMTLRKKLAFFSC